jgi:hypothetical protein
MKLSPVFGLNVMNLYKSGNEEYNLNPVAATILVEDAEKSRALIALDLRFTVGCNCEWTPYDGDAADCPHRR